MSFSFIVRTNRVIINSDDALAIIEVNDKFNVLYKLGKVPSDEELLRLAKNKYNDFYRVSL